MIHFLPLEAAADATGPADAELFARMGGLRRALRLVDPFGGGPASDYDAELDAAGFASSGAAVKRCFDRRSERVISAAAAGLEAVVGERSTGRVPNDASLAMVAQEIRAGLQDLSGLLRA